MDHAQEINKGVEELRKKISDAEKAGYVVQGQSRLDSLVVSAGAGVKSEEKAKQPVAKDGKATFAQG